MKQLVLSEVHSESGQMGPLSSITLQEVGAGYKGSHTRWEWTHHQCSVSRRQNPTPASNNKPNRRRANAPPPTTQQRRQICPSGVMAHGVSSDGLRGTAHPGKMICRCPFIIPNKNRGGTTVYQTPIAQKVASQAS